MAHAVAASWAGAHEDQSSHELGPDGVCRYIELATMQLVASGYRDGCPVATVTLEMTPASPELTDACAGALNAWGDTLATALREAGARETRAHELATLVV